MKILQVQIRAQARVQVQNQATVQAAVLPVITTAARASRAARKTIPEHPRDRQGAAVSPVPSLKVAASLGLTMAEPMCLTLQILWRM